MQAANFKKKDGHLSFNSQNAEPIFVILQELELGYLYFQETKPFGPVSFVWRESVIDEDEDVNDQGVEPSVSIDEQVDLTEEVKKAEIAAQKPSKTAK